jgi:hypothetical protein
LIQELRDRIAAWLSPEMAKKAVMHDWLESEISYEARWLSEFKFVSRTLDRLLILKHAHFRPLDMPWKMEEEYEISHYREDLRRIQTEGELK